MRGIKSKKYVEDNSQVLALLNQSLNLEYSMVIHYPRIASAIKDEETRNLANNLGEASIGHADTVANTIIKLGGSPRWSFKPLPYNPDVIKIFEIQLEKEKQALQLHRHSAGLVLDSSLRDNFNKLAKEEEQHVKAVEKILSRLGRNLQAAGI
jgi:bacterioferritin